MQILPRIKNLVQRFPKPPEEVEDQQHPYSDSGKHLRPRVFKRVNLMKQHHINTPSQNQLAEPTGIRNIPLRFQSYSQQQLDITITQQRIQERINNMYQLPSPQPEEKTSEAVFERRSKSVVQLSGNHH